MPPEFAEFWYLAYHTLFWLDLYLSGCPEEEFAPPAPFTWVEIDPAVLLERPYTKEELHAYLAATRRKCQATLVALTDERARQAVEYPWAEGQAVSFLELQLYNMRHVQEHAAQLSLFLGQQRHPGRPRLGRAAGNQAASKRAKRRSGPPGAIHPRPHRRLRGPRTLIALHHVSGPHWPILIGLVPYTAEKESI